MIFFQYYCILALAYCRIIHCAPGRRFANDMSFIYTVRGGICTCYPQNIVGIRHQQKMYQKEEANTKRGLKEREKRIREQGKSEALVAYIARQRRRIAGSWLRRC
jgi:hypothetical protein